ncbi:MAG TPA: hypothetical protein VH302_08520 [Bryobacteraceae bacterium]|jgi:hypothetical protein|nr:hypothetical protein [Bryobacteraceae bacterium]
MQEKRSDTRLLCAELVQLVWQNEAGQQRRSIANLEDISLCGACIQVEREIRAGTPVAINYGDGELLGTVRYCLSKEFGYFLGIELNENSRWSSQHYKPEHLLDPRELVEKAMLRREPQPEAAL